MKNLCEDRCINSKKESKNMNEKKSNNQKNFGVINAPFVEINGAIVNLLHVVAARPKDDGVLVYFTGDENPTFYKISYRDFKSLLNNA